MSDQPAQARFETRVFESVCEISPQEWDEISAGRPFSSHGWYRLGEVLQPDSRRFIILLYHQGKAIARATFWEVRYELLPPSMKWARRALETIFRLRPLMICRSPFSGTSGLILPEEPLRKPALRQITEQARLVGRKLHASFLVFDYLRPDQNDLPDWPLDFIPYQIEDPGTLMPIQWDRFEDYVQSLSHSARKDFRRQRNQAARLGIEVCALDHVDSIEEAIPLIRNIENKHGSTPNPVLRKMLQSASLVPLTWIEARIGPKLVGCGLLLEDNGAQATALIGLDYSVQYVYFQLIYTAVQSAIAKRSRLLYGGSGVYDLKERLGFQVDQNNYLRYSGQNRFLQWVGQTAAR